VSNLNDTSHALVLKNEGSSRGDGIVNFVGFRLTAAVSVGVGGGGGGSGTESKPDIAAIVGGVIGGLAGLILIGFFGYLCLRRQKRHESDVNQDSNHAPAADGFNVNAPTLLNRTVPVPMTEKQRLAAGMNAQNQDALRSDSQANLLPFTSKRRPSVHHDTSDSSSTSHPHQHEHIDPNNQQPPDEAPPPAFPTNSPPPSFRTQPHIGTHQYFAIVPADAYNSGSSERNYDDHGNHPDSQDQHQSSHDESSNAGETDYSQIVPPYIGDVLSRPDARNLSEADVDNIARRLADVMRVQSNRRDRDPEQPGLFQAWPAPPRELIDQMVEEHLEAQETER
jgi:hypothetical protein